MIRKFMIPGAPVPKGRPRFRIVKANWGVSAQAYTDKKTKEAEENVAIAYLMNYSVCTETPLEVDIVFYLPIAKSTPKYKMRDMLCGDLKHTSKPDIDNLTKMVLDGLNGVAYKDDKLITTISAEKRYSDNPRTEVTLCSKD